MIVAGSNAGHFFGSPHVLFWLGWALVLLRFQLLQIFRNSADKFLGIDPQRAVEIYVHSYRNRSVHTCNPRLRPSPEPCRRRSGAVDSALLHVPERTSAAH